MKSVISNFDSSGLRVSLSGCSGATIEITDTMFDDSVYTDSTDGGYINTSK